MYSDRKVDGFGSAKLSEQIILKMKVLLATFLGIGMSACSQAPVTYIPSTPVVAGAPGCSFVRYDLSVDPSRVPGLSSSTTNRSRSDYSASVEAALASGSGDLLFLSGGSQNGAFGSGFLVGWQERSSGLPDFSVVTGISTGALQSTPAFIGRSDLAAAGYTIDREDEILEAYVDGGDLESGLPIGVMSSLVRQGSISDLVPLRSRLHDMLEDGVLHKVASKHKAGGRLYVGATDFDSGNAVAFDMGEMATRFASATDKLHRELYKQCYIEALVASSIVPVAAKPVFIDKRMYIDGGVRFAVFAEDVSTQLMKADAKKKKSGPGEASNFAINVYAILNGDGKADLICGARDKARCTGPGGSKDPSAEHEDWDFLTLALRSVELLTNQVAMLSIDRALNLPRDQGANVHFARLSEESTKAHDFSSHRFSDQLRQRTPTANRTCDEWRKVDIELDDPVEFHPRYMQCLLSLGKERGKAFDWDRQPAMVEPLQIDSQIKEPSNDTE